MQRMHALEYSTVYQARVRIHVRMRTLLTEFCTERKTQNSNANEIHCTLLCSTVNPEILCNETFVGKIFV